MPPTNTPADPIDLTRLALPEPTRSAIATWLREPIYADVRAELERTVRIALSPSGPDQKRALAELEDAFSGTLPIGTGGRRGPCGPGPNRVNSALMRETARGLAAAMRQTGAESKVAVVYDTRATSRTFALVVAAALTAEAIEVTLIDAPRPTPQLSYLARRLGCGAGVVISASHNPPTDNGIKVYGPDGAQVLGELDRVLMEAIIEAGRSGSLPEIDLEGISAGRVPVGVIRIDPNAEPDRADRPYHDYVLAQGVSPGSLADSGLRVAYTALHGVGDSSVIPVLRARGLDPVIVESQLPDGGEFETVKSANPESPAAFDVGLVLAKAHAVDLLLATDPDADRVGAMFLDRAGEYRFVDGNRLGVLMLEHVLRRLAARGSDELGQGWVLTTLVSSPLIATLARSYSVEVVDDLLVGFKFHAGIQADAEQLGLTRSVVFACEESHGYLRGNDIRDKDGAIAAMLLADCAAECKQAGQTVFDRLAEIWQVHGYHRERTGNLYAPGSSGRRAIAAVMDELRDHPPATFGGLDVVEVVDRSRPRETGWRTRDLPGNVMVYELRGGGRGCRLVFRPSGTEPKIKVYALARGLAEITDPSAAEAECEGVDRLIDAVLVDAEQFAKAVMDPIVAAS